MIVYIDILFIINFSADFIIFLISDLKDKTKISRMIVGAFFGGLYSCLSILGLPGFLFNPAARLIYLVYMCLLVYFPCSIRKFSNKYVSFLIVCIFANGLLKTITPNSYKSFLIQDYWLAIAFTLTYYCTSFFAVQFKKSAAKGGYNIKICYNKNMVTTTAIMDTGNGLTEPITGIPVIVINEDILKDLFSKSANRNNLCEFVEPCDFKIIPFKTINTSGISYGFVPDKVFINDRKIAKCIVSVAPSEISEKALLNPLLI